jgi:hypothetical protein
MGVGRLQEPADATVAASAREDSVLGKSRSLYLCLLVGSALVGAALSGVAGLAAGPDRLPGRGATGYVNLMADAPSVVVPELSDGVVSVKDFGAVGNGIADDTSAVRAAINSLAATGGTVFFPVGRYRIEGQLALPNDGADTDTRQPPFVFSGVGAFYDPRKGIPTGGSILDLRFDGPKIVTYGLGLFEAHGVTFASFGGDSEPFIYTTNTTLHIHNCCFYGNKPHHTADNDAIVLGGTNAAAVGSNDPNAPFQGYGTVIRDNFFARIRRAVYGRVFANAVVVTGNTVWSNCGTNLPEGAAIELDGDPDETTMQVNGGWYVAGNLIETTHYPFGIKCRESQRNAFIANNFYDPGAVTIAYHRFESTGRLNYVVAGFHDDSRVFVQEGAIGTERSTVIDFHQLQESRYAQKSRFLDDLFLEPSSSSEAPYGPRLVSSGGAELTYQMTDDSGMVVWYTPNLGVPVPLWQVKDFGGGNIVQELKGTNAEIRNVNGSVKILSAAGSELELGDTSGEGVRIEEGKIEFSSTSVQMLSGAGEPTESAPNGSIYLRTDGSSGTTFYVREAGAWVAK